MKFISGFFQVLFVASLLSACSDNTSVAVGQTAMDRVELISEAPEPIIEIPVKEGDVVNHGDIVIRQQPQRTGTQLQQAAAARDQAAARLAELKRGPRSELIDEAQAKLKGAESRLRNARLQLQRATDLVEKNLASQSDLDQAQANFDSSNADAGALRADLQALLQGTTIEELQQAEAAFKQAQARWRELQVTMSRLTVTAPRDGVIDTLPFEIGERPQAGAIVAVMLAGQPYARVYVPESLRARLKPGVKLTLHVDGIAEPLQGRVRFVASDATFTPFFALTEHDRTRLSYLAEIDFENSGDRSIPAGIPVQADLSSLSDE